MQSLLQYRNLRREVQDDILRTQRAKRPAGSFADASTISPDTATQTDVEGQSEKSTPSVDRVLFAGVKVLHTDDSEDGVIFVVNWKENARIQKRCSLPGFSHASPEGYTVLSPKVLQAVIL